MNSLVHYLKIDEIREALVEKLEEWKDEQAREIVRTALEKWDKVSEFIDMALLNHGYSEITIPLTLHQYSVFIKLAKDEVGEWKLVGIRFGEKVGWGYTWEYILSRDIPLRRRKRLLEKRVEVM